MRWCALLALCACNRILGLGDVQSRPSVDAQQFDAPPPRCPDVGTGVPVFGKALHQLGISQCNNFVLARDGTRMAMCLTGITGLGAMSARAGETLAPIVFVADPSWTIQEPRLARDGKSAAVIVYDTTAQRSRAVFATIDAAGAWVSQGELPITLGTGFRMLTPSSGPHYHVVYIDYDSSDANTYKLFEIAFDGSSWHEQDRYPLVPLGVPLVSGSAAMTADGLHVVVNAFTTRTVTVFSDRATIDDRFGAFRQLDTVPTAASDPFITEDCGQLYFSALERVLYLEQ